MILRGNDFFRPPWCFFSAASRFFLAASLHNVYFDYKVKVKAAKMNAGVTKIGTARAEMGTPVMWRPK